MITDLMPMRLGFWVKQGLGNWTFWVEIFEYISWETKCCDTSEMMELGAQEEDSHDGIMTYVFVYFMGASYTWYLDYEIP